MSYADEVRRRMHHDDYGDELILFPDALQIAGQADAEIASLRAENGRLRKREAHLLEMLTRCERDAQRALRVANSDSTTTQQEFDALYGACEAIQQRVEGLREE